MSAALKKRPCFTLALAAALVLIAHSCGTRTPFGSRVAVSDTRVGLGSFMQITLVTGARGTGEARRAIEAAFALVKDFEARVDYRNEEGRLWEFNRGTDLLRSDDEALFSLVDEALAAARFTGGYFDPTILPLVRLWGFDSSAPRVPAGGEIAAALGRVGHGNVAVRGDRIIKPRDVEIDLSGIAQGKAVDMVRDHLRSAGYRDFLINASGDIYAGGRNAAGKKWRIAVQDPVHMDRYSGIVNKSDAAVVTSGDYERFFTEGGKRYCHILNPFTGYPQSDLKSVTVLAPDTVTADFLSTAVFAMGSGKGLEFLLLNGFEGYLIYGRNGKVESVSTPGFWK